MTDFNIPDSVKESRKDLSYGRLVDKWVLVKSYFVTCSECLKDFRIDNPVAVDRLHADETLPGTCPWCGKKIHVRKRVVEVAK